MSVLSIFAPAKLNLFLAITGRRADGYHELLSVVVKLDFGDTLHAEPAAEFSLRCDAPELPVDDSNLILKAARAFAAATGWNGGARFTLEKKIPTGAGLGGGSSDAVAALRALTRIAGPKHALSPGELFQVAAQVGSDCPLFLHEGPVVMRGRGELIGNLPSGVARRLSGRRVLVFKPGFEISTPWAYAQLAAGAPGTYLAADVAEKQLAAWIGNPAAPAEALLFNNMEPPAFAKFVALPVMLSELRGRFGMQPRMSGSGSACFALLQDDSPAADIEDALRAGWGTSVFAIQTRVT